MQTRWRNLNYLGEGRAGCFDVDNIQLPTTCQNCEVQPIITTHAPWVTLPHLAYADSMEKLKLSAINEGRVRERKMTEKPAVSRPGCISKHQELVRQVSEGQSTMINTLHKTLSSSILSFTGLLKLDPSPWSSLVPDLPNFCSCTKSKPHPWDAHRSSGLVLQIHHS